MLTAFDPDCRFATSEYKAGDVLLLSVFTVHGALANTTSSTIRLNIDCRWQPKQEGWDELYLTGGDDPFPGVAWDGGQSPTELIDDAALHAGGEREKRRGRPGTLTLDEQKAAWGLPPPAVLGYDGTTRSVKPPQSK